VSERHQIPHGGVVYTPPSGGRDVMDLKDRNEDGLEVRTQEPSSLLVKVSNRIAYLVSATLGGLA
jgi:hypothetical protein